MTTGTACKIFAFSDHDTQGTLPNKARETKKLSYA